MASYIDEILNSKKGENYYDLLGVSAISSTEQIHTEYKRKAVELHPDKNSDPTAVSLFQRIQTAKSVLCDPESRKDYDLWLASGITMPFDKWMAFKDTHKTSMHWIVREKMDPMLEARKDEDPGHEDLLSMWQKSENAVTSEILERFRRYEV